MSTAVTRWDARQPTLRATARLAGIFYLGNILTILCAVGLFRRIIVPGDAADSAANILAHALRFRSAIALELCSTACSLAVAALFYVLFEAVNRNVSLVAALCRLTACAIAVVGYLLQVAPLQILGVAQPGNGLSGQQVQTIAFLLYRLHGTASDMVIVFFGFHFVLIGYLILRAGFLPRWLGVLAVLGGVLALTFLAPPVARPLFPIIMATGLLLEVSLTVCLLRGRTDGANW